MKRALKDGAAPAARSEPQTVALSLFGGALICLLGLIGTAILHRPPMGERRVLAADVVRRDGRFYVQGETNFYTGIMVLPSKSGKAQAVSITGGRVSGCLERCSFPARGSPLVNEAGNSPEAWFGRK